MQGPSATGFAPSFGRTTTTTLMNGAEKRVHVPSWMNAGEVEFDWDQEHRKRRRVHHNYPTINCYPNQPSTTINCYPNQPSTFTPCPGPVSGLLSQRTRIDDSYSTSATGFTPSSGSVSDLLSSLLSQGVISLDKVNKPQPQADDSGLLEFDQKRLKVRNENVITKLYSAMPRQCASCGCRFLTPEEHRNHMDWHVRKNRRVKNRKIKPSMGWFVTSGMYVGVGASEGGPIRGETTGKAKEAEEVNVNVPADEEQTECALCGERFEDYYCHERDSWMYKGAVYMNGTDGKLGRIVHAKCR